MKGTPRPLLETIGRPTEILNVVFTVILSAAKDPLVDP